MKLRWCIEAEWLIIKQLTVRVINPLCIWSFIWWLSMLGWIGCRPAPAAATEPRLWGWEDSTMEMTWRQWECWLFGIEGVRCSLPLCVRVCVCEREPPFLLLVLRVCLIWQDLSNLHLFLSPLFLLPYHFLLCPFLSTSPSLSSPPFIFLRLSLFLHPSYSFTSLFPHLFSPFFLQFLPLSQPPSLPPPIPPCPTLCCSCLPPLPPGLVE